MAARKLNIGNAELSVLKVLWDAGPATVREVLERLHLQGRKIAYTTVQTLLARLEQKGSVKCDKTGLAYVYRAKVSRDAITRSRVKALVTQLYDGSAGPLILDLVRSGSLSSEEVEALQKMINDLENGSEAS